MKNKLHYSPEALRDLDETWDYIVIDLANSDAAENIANGMMWKLIIVFCSLGTI